MFPRIRKGTSLCGFDWKENPEKGLRQKKVREKKISFEIHVRILNFQKFLLEHPFSFMSETVLKIANETNQGDVKSICARVTKHASKKVAKAEVNLN